MKKVIITGSSGLCATELIHHLCQADEYQIYAVSTNPAAIIGRYPQNKVTCVSLQEIDELFSGEGEPIDICIHFAFARNGNPSDIASSLCYLKSVLEMVKDISLRSFVYISSQSVYGQKEKPFWTEGNAVSPESLYALGKYAGELLVDTALHETSINYTNIRLASVCENARFLSTFAKNALSGSPIKVLGGGQTCSFIDVRDVAEAITCVIEKADQIRFAEVYNLGTGEKAPILELAELTQRIAKKYYDIDVDILKEKSDIRQDVGMDSTRFKSEFSWRPKYGYADMVLSLLNLHSGGGGVPYTFKIKYNMGL